MAYIPFDVVKSGTTRVYTDGSTEKCILTSYTTTPPDPGKTLARDAAVLNSTLVSYNLNIVAYSANPIVTVNKTYTDAGVLETTSTLVVNKLENGTEGGKDIPANTTIKLYEADATADPESGDFKLTKKGGAIAQETVAMEGGSATFTLNGTDVDPATAKTDYILTATEPDKDESTGVSVLANTAVLDIPNDYILTAYDTTTTQFATNSHVRVYDIDGVDIDEFTKVYLYDAANDSEAIETFDNTDMVLDSDNSAYYIKVDMEGRDSTKTYYLTASQGNRAESPVRYPIRKQSYTPNAPDVTCKNNLADEASDTMLVTKVVKEDGSVVAISEDATIKVYEDANVGTEAMGGLSQTKKYDEEEGSTFVGIEVTLPQGTFGEDGKSLWITSTETDRLESSKVEVVAPASGVAMIGLVAVDGTVVGGTAAGTSLSESDKAKLAAKTDASPVGNPIKVPAGVKQADYTTYGFGLTNVPVYLAKEIEDPENSGTMTQIAFVNFESWNQNEILGEEAKITSPANPDAPEKEQYQDYTITGTVTPEALKAAGVSLAEGYTPQATARVINKSIVTDIVDPTDPDATFEEGKHNVPDPVIVPEGTKQEELAIYGLESNQIAVKFTPALSEDDGEVTIKYIDIVWNYSDLSFPLEITNGDPDHQDYILTGTLDAEQLAEAGLDVSDIVYVPHTTVRVTKKKVGTGVVEVPSGDIIPTPTEPASPTIPPEDLDDVISHADNFEQTIYVPRDTTSGEAKAKIPSAKGKLAVVSRPGDDGKEYNIDYITVNWDTSSLPSPDTEKLTEDKYVIPGTLKQEELDEKGIVLSAVLDLKINIIVTDLPTITLNKGNTNARDLEAGRSEADIFVFRGYTFSDPGFTIKNSKGETVSPEDAGVAFTRKYKVKDAADTTLTALDTYSATEILDCFTLVGYSAESNGDYSKTYELIYTYTDPVTKLEGTATRTVYVIYKRGDVDRVASEKPGLEITTNDNNAIKKHAFNVSFLDLSDPLFLEKSADIDYPDTSGVSTQDYNMIKKHVFNISFFEQEYASEKVTVNVPKGDGGETEEVEVYKMIMNAD